MTKFIKQSSIKLDFSKKEASLLAQRKCFSLPNLFLCRNKEIHKSSGGGNVVDFYTGLKLDKPLNKNMKTYV